MVLIPTRPIFRRPAAADLWADLIELRLRTLIGDPDDPLAEQDWEAAVWIGDRQATAWQTAWRHRTRTRLPQGIWTFRTGWDEGLERWVVTARFDGYTTGWERCSARTKADNYRWSVLWDAHPLDPDPPGFQPGDSNDEGTAP